MQNKWRNLGDVNHREEGGKFVQVDWQTETVEVVTVDIIQDWKCKDIYYLQEAGYSFDDLKEVFSKKDKGVYNSFDWKRLENTPFDNIVELLAIDLINFSVQYLSY